MKVPEDLLRSFACPVTSRAVQGDFLFYDPKDPAPVQGMGVGCKSAPVSKVVSPTPASASALEPTAEKTVARKSTWRTRCRAILFQRVCRRHLYIGASV